LKNVFNINILNVMKIFDYIIVIFSSIVLIFSFIIVFNDKNYDTLKVKIQIIDDYYLYPLDEDRKMTLKSYIDDTIIEIKDKKVSVLQDPGPKQICVLHKPIYKVNQWIICLPSKVFITIEGQENDEIDIILN